MSFHDQKPAVSPMGKQADARKLTVQQGRRRQSKMVDLLSQETMQSHRQSMIN